MSFEKQYSYELSYNPYNFYYSTNRQDLPGDEKCKELKEENESVKTTRLLLSEKLGNTLKNGMALLGCSMPERM